MRRPDTPGEVSISPGVISLPKKPPAPPPVPGVRPVEIEPGSVSSPRCFAFPPLPELPMAERSVLALRIALGNADPPLRALLVLMPGEGSPKPNTSRPAPPGEGPSCSHDWPQMFSAVAASILFNLGFPLPSFLGRLADDDAAGDETAMAAAGASRLPPAAFGLDLAAFGFWEGEGVGKGR